MIHYVQFSRMNKSCIAFISKFRENYFRNEYWFPKSLPQWAKNGKIVQNVTKNVSTYEEEALVILTWYKNLQYIEWGNNFEETHPLTVNLDR